MRRETGIEIEKRRIIETRTIEEEDIAEIARRVLVITIIIINTSLIDRIETRDDETMLIIHRLIALSGVDHTV